MVVNGLQYKEAHMRAKGGRGFFYADSFPRIGERIRLELPTAHGVRSFDIGSVTEVRKLDGVGRCLVTAELKPRLRGLVL
ncbi:TPA: hypothetical protein LC309_001300 [Salmonella enterica subsp. enterica serovar Nyanza]|nr:hypothetical protein [Salmonella enterica subsp. enterica serovar Agoueve]ECW0159724.1 hypothetical protein [Salmonella enterica subsp. enterica serovar Durham]EDV3146892.1 hypothetical protein [Salmonella enterica subsp. enterica]EHK8181151.1 hypothetical protein [Salmonella enterica subsp. enterica serovar Enteritidis]EHV2052635.1 hypothetical protein [Salmonella enterica]HBJ6456781.1 hypothetical protein [Salmonella enterica subsp. enterica serovar Nyanza]